MIAGRVAVGVLLLAAFVGVEGDTVVVKEGEDKEVYQNRTQPEKSASTLLCVDTGGSLEAVCVRVGGPEPGVDVEECFTDIKACNLTLHAWNPVIVAVTVTEGVFSGRSKVIYNLTLGGCAQTKNDDYKSEDIASLSVSARGESHWLHPNQPGACPDPPTAPASDSWSTDSTHVIVGVVWGVLGVLAGLGAGVGWLAYKKRQGRHPVPQ